MLKSPMGRKKWRGLEKLFFRNGLRDGVSVVM
jgi:hypothetical protein